MTLFIDNSEYQRFNITLTEMEEEILSELLEEELDRLQESGKSETVYNKGLFPIDSAEKTKDYYLRTIYYKLEGFDYRGEDVDEI